MDDYFEGKGILKEETKHTQSYSGPVWQMGWRTGIEHKSALEHSIWHKDRLLNRGAFYLNLPPGA